MFKGSSWTRQERGFFQGFKAQLRFEIHSPSSDGLFYFPLRVAAPAGSTFQDMPVLKPSSPFELLMLMLNFFDSFPMARDGF